MYTKLVPFKDFNDKPRNMRVHFNLTETEVFKLLVELKAIFSWRDSLMEGEDRELETEEVVEFYNNFEEVLLTAYGVPSEDGLYFSKTDRYKFQESALFNAVMVMFVTDPAEVNRALENMLPKGMEEIVKKADANLAEAAKSSSDERAQAEIARLRAQLAAAEGTGEKPPAE